MSSVSKQHYTLRDDNLLLLKYMSFTFGIKLVTLEKHNGKSINIIKEYISSCKMMFQLVKSNYLNNIMKVLYALQFLTGEMKRA